MTTYKMNEEQRDELVRLAWEFNGNADYPERDFRAFLDSLAVPDEPEGATAKFKVGDRVGVRMKGDYGIGTIEDATYDVNFGCCVKSAHREAELETLSERAARLRAEADACDKEAGE